MNWIYAIGLLTLELCLIVNQNNLVHGSTTSLFSERPTSKCQNSLVYSMLQTTCYSMDLIEVPQHFKTSLQILDLSHNRINQLHNKTFEKYPKIAYLYLRDNFITDLEEGTFDSLYYLQALDLSYNAINVIPKNIFHMTYLRKFYVSRNKILDSSFDGKVTAPISHLDLSINQLSKIPNLGPMADLDTLNVSNNKISQLSVDDIAPFCSLKVLDLRNNDLMSWSNNSCECQLFEYWIKLYDINAKYDFKCLNSNKCKNVSLRNETISIKENCTQIIETKEMAKKTRSTWILIASCVGTFCACVFIILCCIHNRNKKRRLQLKEEQKMAANNMQNTELLHNQRNS